MNSLHLVDPGLLPLLEAFPNFVFTPEALAAIRAQAIQLPPSGDWDVEIEDIAIPGPGGQLGLRLYRPRGVAGPMGCIYHIHGGGYLFGSAAQMEHEHKPLSARLGCTIVSVDYRLAPETAFPGNLEDCYTGLAWTFANAGRLGLDTDRIGVMGESAGGGLAAALALLVRDRGEYQLSFQQLIYPMIDDRTCVREPHPFTGDFVWQGHNNHFGWSAILGCEPGSDGISPYAAASRAEDLSGLPPAFVSVGALDLFLEENIEYARRLTRAGVPTELHVWPGAFHAFEAMPNNRVADAARAASLSALKAFLALAG